MKNIVITGSNRGIGLALVNEYYKVYKAHVIAICRTQSLELRKLADSGSNIEVLDGIDVTSDQAIATLLSRVRRKVSSIDLLINNAGIYIEDSLEQLSSEKLMIQFKTNSLAPLIITKTLLPLLHQGSKVAMISSQMGSIGDNDSGNSYGYRASKAALNALGKNLAIDLRKREIAVFQFHPGYVNTDMTKHLGPILPTQSAESLAKLMEELTLNETGTFWHMNGKKLEW